MLRQVMDVSCMCVRTEKFVFFKRYRADEIAKGIKGQCVFVKLCSI